MGGLGLEVGITLHFWTGMLFQYQQIDPGTRLTIFFVYFNLL